MRIIEINGANGIGSLAAAAIEFAVDDLEAASRTLRGKRKSADTPGVKRIRARVAVRRLESARQQLKAAIALSECEA